MGGSGGVGGVGHCCLMSTHIPNFSQVFHFGKKAHTINPSPWLGKEFIAYASRWRSDDMVLLTKASTYINCTIKCL